jgi:hypothetical protein
MVPNEMKLTFPFHPPPRYVPACAYTIHERNAALPAGDAQRINLKGLSIGDGAMDPARWESLR